MNLSNRIKKIEEKLIVEKPASKFCECYEKHFMSVFNSVYEPEKETVIHPMPDLEKGYCELCKKTISSRDIEYQKGIEKIYGDTPTYAYFCRHLKRPDS